MSEILFLAHRMPFPPDRGDKIRSHHILKALAALAPVHVGTFAETAADKAAEPDLAKVATRYCLRTRAKPLALAGMQALARREPANLAAFRDPALAAWVRETLAIHDIGAIYVFSSQMGQYVPADWRGRLVVDLVDVDSAKYEAYAAAKPWPLGWVEAREARLLSREEARLAARADRTLLVSHAEAALLASRLPEGSPARIVALGNGIDADGYDPAKVTAQRDLGGPGPHLIFTGQMDYRPNIEAAHRAIEAILPGIRVVHPDAMFHIVGRAPVAELVTRDGHDGLRVWGEVPDVRPFLAAADLVLAPLTIARGIQNKALEAMAMARPVLLSREAATGIAARDGEQFVIADDDSAFVAKALALLADRPAADRLGAAARRLVVDTLSWPAALAELPALMGLEPQARPRRNAA